MGVPAFFRWLSKKYPSIIISCVEDKARRVSGQSVPVDATQENPNGVEFDNLYLDMNGIIHPCCHPEDKPAPKDEDEMMVAIFEYIDRIFNIVRPRRLLYMAIDGVAPRAKMNQQRSRRFRAAKESVDKQIEISQAKAELREKGFNVPPDKKSYFDSNCITPGTPFMARLAVCLEYYVHERMNSNPAWKGIKVILSDASVPGEGEHKIMDYIRRQRGNPDHDPNTHHCLYGADADLIMLGLSTHEPHFTILREEFNPNQSKRKPCEICNQYGHEMRDCTGVAREKQGQFDQLAPTFDFEKQFLFIRLSVLREYLQRDLAMTGLTFQFDFERAVDDWVFLCFFVGNDFLPHLPSLQIREGAIDRLVRLYKEVVPRTRGYLTTNGIVHLHRVQFILSELGKVEDDIFRQRHQRDQEFKERNRNKRQRMDHHRAPSYIPGGNFAPVPLGTTPPLAVGARQDAYQMRCYSSLSANQEAASSFKKLLKGDSTEVQASPSSSRPSENEDEKRGGESRKRPLDTKDDSDTEDEVRLWEEGWKERYYMNKFHVSSDDEDFVARVAESYVLGLCWVMGYYYQGCPSWKWYYPFHYAPFASDFRHIADLNNTFTGKTEPFRPLEQLMGVFPGASSKFLPPCWQKLMLDEESPIIDFYPTDFKIDLNGKKFAWQGVALLPFVDEERLLRALEPIYDTLTTEERQRNSRGSDHLFVHKYNKLYSFVHSLYEDYTDDQQQKGGVTVELNPAYTGGVRGTVRAKKSMKETVQNGGLVESPVPDLPHVKQTQVLSVYFTDPEYPDDHVFQAVMLPGATLPSNTLKPVGHSGLYRPQVGFTAPGHHRSYSTPDSAQRMIRHSMTDPRDSRSSRYHPYSTPPPPAQQYERYSSSYGGYPQHHPPPPPPHHLHQQHQQPPSMASWTPLPPPPSQQGRGGYYPPPAPHYPPRPGRRDSYPPYN